ncbi:hypothetical protein RV11_GL002737 [Enterococcus phoeniculicola]|nr:hypothetical protein RV11_GL002737 [Enterococcus phoeniculicola]
MFIFFSLFLALFFRSFYNPFILFMKTPRLRMLSKVFRE